MTLRASLYGDFSLHRGADKLPLPASKKTRALLVFLLLNSRPQRRERLCEMLWDRTDDPRAALRWSLSKLRPLVNAGADGPLFADRDKVELNGQAIATEADAIEDMLAQDNHDVGQVQTLLTAIDDVPLAELDLPDCDIYQAWLVAERDRLSDLRERLAELGEGKEAGEDGERTIRRSQVDQTIRFCKSSDGVTIAYASAGEGPPLVKAANWLTHLEDDWSSPLDSGQLHRLISQNRLIRYDGRGNGLSDWDVKGISFDQMVADLEAVVEASNLERFPLIGLSQGAAVAIEYAARHPDRITHLVLHGGFAAGWHVRGDAGVIQEREAVRALMMSQWGSENPNFRHFVSSSFIPGAEPIEIDWFSDFQRKTTSAKNVGFFLDAFGQIDVRHRLPQLTVPTLVAHSRDDQLVTMQEARELATQVPQAKFLDLDSANHSLLDREPATEKFLDAALDFIRQ